MAQPTATGLQLNAGADGNKLGKTTHGGFDYQWAFACWWETVGDSPEVPTLASPFPVQPGTGITWAIGSVIPGVGATNLGKAEDAAHTSGDVGVMMLSVRQDNAMTLSDTDGDYAPLTTSDHGCLNVDPQHFYELDGANATAGWSVFNNDTTNLTTSLNHVVGTASLSFDKTDGGANTTIALIDRTITSLATKKFMEEGGGFVLWSVYIPSIAAVTNALLRLGTDDSNYTEWQVPVADLTAAAWNNIRVPMTRPSAYAGNGWDTSAVTYLALGVTFGSESDALADILVDSLFLNSGLHVSSDISANITTGNVANAVRVTKWNTTAVTVGQGNSDAGTLRVAVATDDINLAAAKVSLEIMDDWDETNRAAVNLIAGQAGIAANAGNMDALTTRIVIATNDTHFGTVGAASDIDGVVHGQLRFIADQLVTIDSDTDAIKTATETMDNVVAVLGTATYAETTTSGNVIGAVRNDDKAPLVDTDNEIGPLQTDNEGALYVNQAAAELKSASGVAATTADMIAAVGGKKLLIVAMSLTATSATVCNVFVDNADNDLWHNTGNPFPMSIDPAENTFGGIVLQYNPAGWFKTDTVNEAVTLNMSAALDIAWSISWIETD